MPGKRGKKGTGARSKACIGRAKKRRTQGCLEKKVDISEVWFDYFVLYYVLHVLHNSLT